MSINDNAIANILVVPASASTNPYNSNTHETEFAVEEIIVESVHTSNKSSCI